eukprot:Lankesteria_metandrocarpae@DN1113_c0_g1_i1.p1
MSNSLEGADDFTISSGKYIDDDFSGCRKVAAESNSKNLIIEPITNIGCGSDRRFSFARRMKADIAPCHLSMRGHFNIDFIRTTNPSLYQGYDINSCRPQHLYLHSINSDTWTLYRYTHSLDQFARLDRLNFLDRLATVEADLSICPDKGTLLDVTVPRLTATMSRHVVWGRNPLLIEGIVPDIEEPQPTQLYLSDGFTCTRPFPTVAESRSSTSTCKFRSIGKLQGTLVPTANIENDEPVFQLIDVASCSALNRFLRRLLVDGSYIWGITDSLTSIVVLGYADDFRGCDARHKYYWYRDGTAVQEYDIVPYIGEDCGPEVVPETSTTMLDWSCTLRLAIDQEHVFVKTQLVANGRPVMQGVHRGTCALVNRYLYTRQGKWVVDMEFQPSATSTDTVVAWTKADLSTCPTSNAFLSADTPDGSTLPYDVLIPTKEPVCHQIGVFQSSARPVMLVPSDCPLRMEGYMNYTFVRTVKYMNSRLVFQAYDAQCAAQQVYLFSDNDNRWIVGLDLTGSNNIASSVSGAYKNGCVTDNVIILTPNGSRSELSKTSAGLCSVSVSAMETNPGQCVYKAVLSPKVPENIENIGDASAVIPPIVIAASRIDKDAVSFVESTATFNDKPVYQGYGLPAIGNEDCTSLDRYMVWVEYPFASGEHVWGFTTTPNDLGQLLGYVVDQWLGCNVKPLYRIFWEGLGFLLHRFVSYAEPVNLPFRHGTLEGSKGSYCFAQTVEALSEWDWTNSCRYHLSGLDRIRLLDYAPVVGGKFQTITLPVNAELWPTDSKLNDEPIYQAVDGYTWAPLNRYLYRLHTGGRYLWVLDSDRELPSADETVEQLMASQEILAYAEDHAGCAETFTLKPGSEEIAMIKETIPEAPKGIVLDSEKWNPQCVYSITGFENYNLMPLEAENEGQRMYQAYRPSDCTPLDRYFMYINGAWMLTDSARNSLAAFKDPNVGSSTECFAEPYILVFNSGSSVKPESILRLTFEICLRPHQTTKSALDSDVPCKFKLSAVHGSSMEGSDDRDIVIPPFLAPIVPPGVGVRSYEQVVDNVTAMLKNAYELVFIPTTDNGVFQAYDPHTCTPMNRYMTRAAIMGTTTWYVGAATDLDPTIGYVSTDANAPHTCPVVRARYYENSREEGGLTHTWHGILSNYDGPTCNTVEENALVGWDLTRNCKFKLPGTDYALLPTTTDLLGEPMYQGINSSCDPINRYLYRWKDPESSVVMWVLYYDTTGLKDLGSALWFSTAVNLDCQAGIKMFSQSDTAFESALRLLNPEYGFADEFEAFGVSRAWRKYNTTNLTVLPSYTALCDKLPQPGVGTALEIDFNSSCAFALRGLIAVNFIPVSDTKNGQPVYQSYVIESCESLDEYLYYSGTRWVVGTLDEEHGYVDGDLTGCPDADVTVYFTSGEDAYSGGTLSVIVGAWCDKYLPTAALEEDATVSCRIDTAGEEVLRFVPTVLMVNSKNVYQAVSKTDSCVSVNRYLVRRADPDNEGSFIRAFVNDVAESAERLGHTADWDDCLSSDAEYIWNYAEGPAVGGTASRWYGPSCEAPREVEQPLTPQSSPECTYKLSGIENYDLIPSTMLSNLEPVFQAYDQNTGAAVNRYYYRLQSAQGFYWIYDWDLEGSTDFTNGGLLGISRGDHRGCLTHIETLSSGANDSAYTITWEAAVPITTTTSSTASTGPGGSTGPAATTDP